MKRVFLLCSMLLVSASTLFSQTLGEDYKLKTIIPVKGRQGIAIDSNYYYVSDSKALYKYDKQGNLIAENKNPFVGLPKAANHFGDIDIYNNEIYTGIEEFVDGQGKNIQIAVYDPETLKFKRALNWDPASGQVEVSGIAIDRARKMVWMSDWVDSRYVYAYDLETGKYHSKMQVRPTPYWTQGIFVVDNKMLITADDGESTWHIPDNIYIADITEVPYTGTKKGEAAGAKAGKIELFREMSDFKRAGEIEGLSIDPVTNELVVLNNRGVQIILGMPKGPFKDEGYTEEVRELYIYEKVK
ncbi:MAG: hypothetical protein ACRDDZ_13410 [Marinifilaceae bacterium]